MDDLALLIAKDAIRDCVARYCRGIDRLDADLMKSAYWPDAIDEHGAFNGNAWAFVDYAVPRHVRFEATMHCIFNHLVEDVDLAAGTARGEIYNVSYMLVPGEPKRVDTWWGRYVDRYERRGDEWRIASRVCVHEWTLATPLEAPMAMPTHLFTQGAADRELRGIANAG